MKPWTYRVSRRGKHNGRIIRLVFQGRSMFESTWFPPWQNDLQRENAKCITEDLNRAFAKRNGRDG